MAERCNRHFDEEIIWGEISWCGNLVDLVRLVELEQMLG
jgi:hypothetical protein